MLKLNVSTIPISILQPSVSLPGTTLTIHIKSNLVVVDITNHTTIVWYRTFHSVMVEKKEFWKLDIAIWISYHNLWELYHTKTQYLEPWHYIFASLNHVLYSLGVEVLMKWHFNHDVFLYNFWEPTHLLTNMHRVKKASCSFTHLEWFIT